MSDNMNAKRIPKIIVFTFIPGSSHGHISKLGESPRLGTLV